MEKFLESLNKAEKIIQAADHMFYITLPLIKDKRLLLRILLETNIAVANCINLILQYEYLFKRISLYTDSKENLRTFEKNCAPRYNITEQELRSIFELFDLVKRHKESPFEFMKNGKVVILSKNLEQKIISDEKIKEFLIIAKQVLKKTRNTILR